MDCIGQGLLVSDFITGNYCGGSDITYFMFDFHSAWPIGQAESGY